MPTLIQSNSIEDAAMDLARANKEADGDVLRTYWFRDSSEVRLIHVEATSLPSTQVEPFYFGSDSAHGIPFRSAVALIRPEDEKQIPLPEGWGEWTDAVVWAWS